MTLMLEVLTWVLCATHCLMMVNISAKLFQNPSQGITKLLTGDEKVTFFFPSFTPKYELDLGGTDLGLVRDTSFCQVISKSIQEQESY